MDMMNFECVYLIFNIFKSIGSIASNYCYFKAVVVNCHHLEGI